MFAGKEDTVLLVADDLDMLMIVGAVFRGKGYRVIFAANADRAVQVLGFRQFSIAAVLIRTGVGESKKIELECLQRGVNVHFMSGVVEEGIIRLRVPEIGARVGELALAAAGLPMYCV